MAVVLGILTAILLLLLVPVRVTASAASGQKAAAALHWLLFSYPLYPRPQKEKPKDGAKKEKKREAEKPDKPRRGIEPLLTQLLADFDRLAHPVQKLLRRTSLAAFSLRIVVVGEDAAATALRFGTVNAAVYSGVAILDRVFALRVRQIEILPGFTAEREEYSFSGELRLVPLAALAAAVQIGFWTLAAMIKSTGAPKKKEEIRRESIPAERKEECHGNQASHQ